MIFHSAAMVQQGVAERNEDQTNVDHENMDQKNVCHRNVEYGGIMLVLCPDKKG